MKVKDAINSLQRLNPDEEIIWLMWNKETFDDWSDDAVLTDEGWNKVVSIMEEGGGMDSGDQQISELIGELVTEHSEEVEEEE